MRVKAMDAENERHERRRVVWRMNEDGYWSLHAHFTPEPGERIMKAIDAAVGETEAEQQEWWERFSGNVSAIVV